MKKLIGPLVLSLFVAVPLLAGSVDVSVPTTTAQDAKLATLLTSVNASRVAAGEAPFSTFNDYATFVLVEAVKGYLKEVDTSFATKVSNAAVLHSDETAPNGQCTAAGLSSGCTKGQVACFVLTGNTTCD